MVFYTADCIKCRFVASAREPQRAIDGLMDHVDALHRADGLVPVLDQTLTPGPVQFRIKTSESVS